MTWQLLAPLGAEDRARLLDVARPRSFSKGEVVFHEGDPGESLHLVKSGRFAVRVSIPSGDTTTLSVLSAGSDFGELALLGENRERTATVVALEPSTTLMLSRNDFVQLRVRHPMVEQLLVQRLARRVDELSKSLLEALYVGVDRRVMRRLLDLGAAYHVPGASTVVVPITQDDLAGMAGTTRPTVNLVLQRLAGDGTVILGRGRIEIVDRAALRRRSGV